MSADFRVIADPSVCIGAGICEEIEPRMFRVDDHGEVSLLLDGVPDDIAESVREAAVSCPSGALRIEPTS